MALRVLLADESVTIKKVIQLALQDFAVEVKAVPVGLDVLEVSKSFQPDLVFADVLLQKRSGYDVCRDLKKDVQTAAIPVILMWSSFMELDQKQVDACGADGRLEKPFEVEALRKLVLDLVPRTRSQRLATFLEYPATIAAPLKSEAAEAAKNRPAPVEKPTATGTLSGMTDNTGTFSTAVRPQPPKGPPPLTIPMPGSTKAAAEAASESPPTSSYIPAIPDRPLTPEPAQRHESPPPTVEYAPATTSQVATPQQAAPPAHFTLGAGVAETSLSEHSSPMFPTGFTDSGARPSKPSTPPPDLAANLTPNLTLDTTQHAEKSTAPLGALPDLQLDGQGSRWNMESFEPLDLSPLNLDDDEAETEAFQPIRLPDTEPTLASKPAQAMTPFGLDDSDRDDDADKWSNKSLEKYRLAPLYPEESLAAEEAAKHLAQITPDFPVLHLDDQEEQTPTPRFEPPKETAIPQSDLENTEILGRSGKSQATGLRKPTPAYDLEPLEQTNDDGDVPEFTLSEADQRNLKNLEIEPVEQEELTRPSIVRELLKDPDFSYDENTARHQIERTVAQGGDNTFDLGSAGRPAQPPDSPPPTERISTHSEGRLSRREESPGEKFSEKSGAFGRDRSSAGPSTGTSPRIATLEERMAAELEPQLERVVERIVADLLPKIAEKIIKRELERLLEDS